MGMFNSIWVDCPECDKPVEFQSKSGSCSLASCHVTQMPVEDFAGIAGCQVCCQNCGSVVGIKDPRDMQIMKDFSHLVY